MTEKKRTDKILDLLDAALQSTTPRHFGTGGVSPDTCVGCTDRPAIEGRSWCELCLPENDDKAPEPSADDAFVQLGFTYAVPLIPGEWFGIEGLVAINVGPEPDPVLVAGVFVDADERPVAVGMNIPALLQLPAASEVIELLARTVADLALHGVPTDLRDEAGE
jgi:hypothetical protein